MGSKLHSLAALTLLLTLAPSVNAEETSEELKPLSTRTRCIVKYRECITLVTLKEVDALLSNIADSAGENGYKLYPTRDSLPKSLRNQLRDVDRFIKRGFRNIPAQYNDFDQIEFSEVQTADESFNTENMATGTESQAKLHVIHVKIPEIDDPEYSMLRFLEVGDHIYWIPTEW